MSCHQTEHDPLALLLSLNELYKTALYIAETAGKTTFVCVFKEQKKKLKAPVNLHSENKRLGLLSV